MGAEITIERATDRPAGDVIAELSAGGLPCKLAMIDGALVAPGATIPSGWREIRLRTTAGMVTLARRQETSIGVITFGNADEALRAVASRISEAFSRR